MKYIDAERLKEILKSNIKQRKKWIKDLHRSNRENQLWSDLNMEDTSIIKIILILQEEQPEIDLEKEFNDFLEKQNAYVNDDDVISYYNDSSFNHTYDIYPIARHFYKLGQLEMRHRITNPEYNAKVIEQLKSEYPATKEE